MPLHCGVPSGIPAAAVKPETSRSLEIKFSDAPKTCIQVTGPFPIFTGAPGKKEQRDRVRQTGSQQAAAIADRISNHLCNALNTTTPRHRHFKLRANKRRRLALNPEEEEVGEASAAEKR